MSDPRRLLHGADATDLERGMLDSWRHASAPTHAARERTLAMVGLATSAALMASAAGSHGAAAGVVGVGGSIAPKAVGIGALAVAKGLGVAVVALATTAAAIVYLQHEVTRPIAPSAIVAPHATAQAAAPVAVLDEGVTTNTAPRAIPAIPANPSATLHAPLVAAQPRPAVSAFAEQVALLDRARTALAAGDAARTRQLVDDYETRFRDGAFSQEADVLRIEAMVQQGDQASARRAGTRFLSAHPTSPHATRVRALLRFDATHGTPP